MSWFSSLLGNGLGMSSGSNPANAAMPYLEQIPGVAEKYYNPYITMGQEAGNNIHSEYQQMLSDPEAYINAIYAAYEPSDAYQYQQEQMLDTASNASAAGGYTGTEDDIRRQEEITQGLLSQDMQQWLNNVLGVTNTGLQGESHLNDIGYGASGQAANMTADALNSQATAAYMGQAHQNAAAGALMNGLLKLMTGGIGAYYGNKALKAATPSTLTSYVPPLYF